MNKVSIISLFAGRFYCLETYLNNLRILNYDPKLIDLIWITNAINPRFLELLKTSGEKIYKKYNFFTLIQIKDLPPTSYAFEENNFSFGIKHAEIIAFLYNEAYKYVACETILFLEDDAIIHPDSIIRLQNLLDNPEVAYATSTYRCRHNNMIAPRQVTVLKMLNADTQEVYAHEIIKVLDGYDQIGIKEIQVGGFVCAMAKKSALDKLPLPTFKPKSPIPFCKHVLGPDVVMTTELGTLGYKNLCDFNLVTGHLDTQGLIH